MNSVAFTETQEFKRGRSGERLVAGVLKRRGCFIVPSYDYSGEDGNKAPKMEGEFAGYVIPDLDVARDGDRYWVEVKTKWTATLHRKSGTVEHGISLRHLDHYRKVQTITGAPVFLAVFEERDGIILIAKLDALGEPRVYDGGKMGRAGMAFWPRAKFRELRSSVPSERGRTT